MASTNHIVDEYLERASQPDVPLDPPSLPKSSTPAAFISQPNVGERVESFAAPAIPAQNKAVVRRKGSTFGRMVLLIATAIVIVLYIGNIIAVGQLMNDINKLNERQQRLLTDQEILRARVNKLAGSERIRGLAEAQLGLAIPAEQPVWIKLDDERVNELERKLGQARVERAQRNKPTTTSAQVE